MSRVTLESHTFAGQNTSTTLIQNSIETSLSGLQEEKKEELLLNREIKVLEGKISEMAKGKFISAEVEGLKKTYAAVLKQVEASYKQVNQIQAENKDLKEKIEDLRLESSKYKRIISGLQEDLATCTSLTKSRSQSKLREMYSEKETQGKINKFLSNSTSEKANVSSQINNLSTVLKRNREQQLQSLKKHSESMQQQLNRPLSALDLSKVISSMIALKVHNINTLKKTIETYTAKQNLIREGFNTIQYATGLPNPIEIAHAFIAFEHTHVEVQTYLLKINADIQSIEFTSKSMISQLAPEKGPLLKCVDIKKTIEKELSSVKKKINSYVKKSGIIEKELRKVDRVIEVIFI